VTQLRRLADSLADDRTTGDQNYALLHWLGCRGFVAGLAGYLALLAELEPAFKRLEALHPNLRFATRYLIGAARLRERLASLMAVEHESGCTGVASETQVPSDWLNASKAPTWPIPRRTPLPLILPCDPTETRTILLFASALLLDLVWSPFCHRLSKQTASSLNVIGDLSSGLPYDVLWPAYDSVSHLLAEFGDHDVARKIRSREQLRPFDLAGLGPALAMEAVSVADCLKTIVADYKARSKATRFGSAENRRLWEHQRAFEDIEKLLAFTAFDGAGVPTLPSDIHIAAGPQAKSGDDDTEVPDEAALEENESPADADPDWSWGDGPTANMSDRQLLGEHPNALTADMKSAIRGLIRDDDVAEVTWPTKASELIDRAAGYLLRVSLATGQLLDDAAATRVVSYDELMAPGGEQILETGLITFVPPDLNTPHRTFCWNPPGLRAGAVHLKLLAPPEWSPHFVDFTVGELLPAPIDSILPIVKERIAQMLGRKEPTSRLAIKHALGRAMFAFNANRAAIRHVCGRGRHKTEGSPEHSSLHHYVAPDCAAVANAHAVAQAHLFGIDASEVKKCLVEHSATSACTIISAERLASLLKRQAELCAAVRPGDSKRCHNRYVLYVAMLLLACTGHREAQQPFHFRFCFDLDEALAFISDKQQVGSEARFVALPPTAVKVIEAYLQHLLWLIDLPEIKASGWVRAIRIAAGLDRPGAQGQPDAAGLFFTFRAGRLLPVSTETIARAFRAVARLIRREEVAPEPITARSLRRNLATYLANRGVPGKSIEWQLGHNGRLHLWGAGSTQVPLHQMADLRPMLEQYLQALGAQPLRPPWMASSERKAKPAVPFFDSSDEDFEGRRMESVAAQGRAREVILRVVDPAELRERGIEAIDDEVLAEIRKAINDELVGDPKARDKVLSELAKMMSSLRAAGLAQSSSALLNLTRFRPGPISVSFGRNLAIARHVVAEAPRAIKHLLQSSAVKDVYPLAVVALVFVVSEAVIRLPDLRALIEALQQDGLRLARLPVRADETGAEVAEQFVRQFRLRATVNNPRSTYARTCDLSDQGAAAVIGYLRTRQDSQVHPWADVLKAVDDMLAIIGRTSEPLSLKQLLVVVRPYWMLRLPGCVYACCVGDFDATAESMHSTQLLLGESGRSYEPPAKSAPWPIVPKHVALAQAKEAVRSILTAAGKEADWQPTDKRAQRIVLRKYFQGQLSADVADWASQQPIVETWVAFLRHLFEEGGPRTDIYAPSSMETYQSRLMPALFEAMWDRDLRQLDGDGFDMLYAHLIRSAKPDQAGELLTVVKIFHEFLWTDMTAPNCKTFPATGRRKRRARSLVLSNNSIARAMTLAWHRYGSESKAGRAARALIAVNSRWGLRVMEGYGLRCHDVGYASRHELRVQRNRARGVKTPSGVRRIPVGAGGKDLCLAADDAMMGFASYMHRPRNNKPVFADIDNPEKLVGAARTQSDAIWALKMGAADASAVNHSLRHTWATSVLAAIAVPKPASPIAKELIYHLPMASRSDLDQVSPSLSVYPLSADRVGMWLGHAAVDTLMTSYGHCIWWAASDCCYTQAQSAPWDDVTIGCLLGKVSASVLKRRKASGAGESLGRQVSGVIQYYMPDNTPPLLDIDADQAATSIVSSTLASKAAAEPDVAVVLSIERLERLLALRSDPKARKERWAKHFADLTGIALTSVEALTQAYAEIVNETGFVDFEPEERRSGRDARVGVSAGHVIRLRALRRLGTLLKSSEAFQVQAAELARRWANGVRKSAPVLVVRNADELKAALAWLGELGYLPGHLIVHTYLVSDADWAAFGVDGLRVVKSTELLSRVRQILPISEFGVGASEAGLLAAERDFQRMFFELAVWERAGMLKRDLA